MIVIRLRGGLGNQMFQYAFALGLAKQLNTELVIDLTALLRVKLDKRTTNRDYQLHIFDIEPNFLIAPKTIKNLSAYRLNFIIQIIKKLKLISIKTFKEKSFNFDISIVKNPLNNTLYNGYWQSEKYFDYVEHDLRKAFRFKESLSIKAQNFLDKINNCNSVCVHIRRGDYVELGGAFNLSDITYFEKGANFISDKENDTHFFIFSDEPAWCKSNIKLSQPFTIVDYKTNGVRYKEDLELMSNCNHHIMSASSFSWWAVWLRNNNNGVVIVPKQWFLNIKNDVIDLANPNWIKF